MNISNELLLYIVGWLNMDDLKNFFTTNKNINELLKDTETITFYRENYASAFCLFVKKSLDSFFIFKTIYYSDSNSDKDIGTYGTFHLNENGNNCDNRYFDYCSQLDTTKYLFGRKWKYVMMIDSLFACSDHMFAHSGCILPNLNYKCWIRTPRPIENFGKRVPTLDYFVSRESETVKLFKEGEIRLVEQERTKIVGRRTENKHIFLQSQKSLRNKIR